MAWQHPALAPSLRKPKIVIGVPHSAQWTAEFTEYTYGPLRWIPVPFADKRVIPSRAGTVTVARNMLAKAFLEDREATHLFFVDSDIVFTKPPDPNEALRLLLSCNEPIVSGVYRARQAVGFNPSMWVKAGGGYVPVTNWSGNWLSVDVIGLGCCLVKREVFERLPEPYFHWDTEPSEDFWWCEQCKKHGFKINVFCEVQAAHIGVLAVEPDGRVRTLRV